MYLFSDFQDGHWGRVVWREGLGDGSFIIGSWMQSCIHDRVYDIFFSSNEKLRHAMPRSVQVSLRIEIECQRAPNKRINRCILNLVEAPSPSQRLLRRLIPQWKTQHQ